jgi:CheY-like chemotaxis protein
MLKPQMKLRAVPSRLKNTYDRPVAALDVGWPCSPASPVIIVVPAYAESLGRRLDSAGSAGYDPVDSEASEPGLAMPECGEHTEASAPPRRVLIVDDEPRVRYALNSLLAAIDAAAGDRVPPLQVVGEAANGQEAVRLVAERQPDVVLMDALMPVMDGIAATRAIKTKWPLVRVVMLTMYADREAEAHAAGVDVFLVKGVPVESLLKALSATTEEEARNRGDSV